MQHIRPGMCLFLFNYTGRMLHGIYEAVGEGALNIEPSAWTDGKGRTQFPAQVILSIYKQSQIVMLSMILEMTTYFYVLCQTGSTLFCEPVSKLQSVINQPDCFVDAGASCCAYHFVDLSVSPWDCLVAYALMANWLLLSLNACSILL